MKKNKNLTTLNKFIETEYGKKGEPKRDKFEEGYKIFKLGALLQEARLKKGMTQDELAIKIGSTKSYISKIENDIKEVRVSTLKKIVEKGLEGKLEVLIEI